MIHGINLDAQDGEQVTTSTTQPVSNDNQPALLFGDPAAYDKMSPEKRDELSQKMMSKWSKWAGKDKNPLSVRKKKK